MAIYPMDSLQCRRCWWSIEWFAAILDSLQTGRIGARMTECRRGGGGGGEGKIKPFFPLPLPLPQFFFLSPTLGKLFTSPQLSTVFLFQDGGLNIRWKYISTRPAKIRLHCRLPHGERCPTEQLKLGFKPFSFPRFTVICPPSPQLVLRPDAVILTFPVVVA